MARPKKKPEYDAEKIRNEFFQELAACYKESSKVSLRDVAEEFDITLLKVRKILITVGEYGKYNTTFYDKLLMDLMYIAKPSIIEDLLIMLATVKILFSKESTEGVREEEQPMMQYEERNKNIDL